jgi:glucose/arabinose dehydrogenase
MRLRSSLLLSAAAVSLATGVALTAAAFRDHPARAACAPDNGGLKLPDGFCASVFADDVGGVRHLEVGPDGVLYAATSGILRGGVTAFRDTDGNGTPDQRATFGPRGANDVAVHDGYVYVATDQEVLRYKLAPGRLAPAGEAETIVADLPRRGHSAKTMAFPGGHVLLVKIGSASNSCQRSDRQAKSPGLDPCTELETRAGIWRFDATRAGQKLSDGHRWATGLRNAEAIEVQPGTNTVWVAVHGRDQLGDNWGFSDQANASNPAEELVQLSEGDDLGWPYCYYSNDQQKKVLAPEYGGDGRTVGRCAKAKDPAIAFPGHWAPMSLAFYQGSAFGPSYAGGLFVAFHGSWNRAPLPQEGYRVVFAPFADGKPTGKYQTFATLAKGKLRAVGLAEGKDGALYISGDDNKTIWRIVKR